MRVSYDILKQFVKPPRKFSARELADVLTMSTVEVDDYIDQAAALDKVVVGLVKAVKPHPNADKLKLASVDVGGKVMEVVCGGVNLREGMKVAFAHVGARVKWHGQGDWVTLEKAKIRGVESHGMACAAEELGLPDGKAVEGGIMDLSHLKAGPGTPLAEALAQNDIILEIDNKSITHRPDLWGHIGLARELAAIWKKEFKQPEAPRIKPGSGVKLSVTISSPDKAQRYLGVVVSGLKIGPSPEWLVQALGSLGMRSINNVVDVTNYVMLELGQPLHAFDLKKLASPEIIVRTAKSGEKITTLDGVERKLDESMLVIADKHQAQAIAGVMGGAASEVSSSTTSIMLESATFEPTGIRQTAGKLGLRTEASARFEKALDPNLALLALRRTVYLLQQVVPSVKVASQIADAYPKKLITKPIVLPLDWLAKRLGVALPVAEVKDILKRLGFTVAGTAKQLKVTPPTWRATRDITIPEDLVEEVARIHGYDKIPLSMPKFDITPPQRDLAQELRWRIRDYLVGAGWVESLSYSFVGKDSLAPSSTEMALELVNPVDSDKRFLRQHVISNLMQQVARNTVWREGRKDKNIKMFEIGRVFGVVRTSSNPEDAQGYDLALCQSTLPKDQNDFRKFQGLRGVVELILEFMGISLPDTEWKYTPNGVEVYLGNRKICMLAPNKDIDSPFIVTYAELDLDVFSSAHIATQYKSQPEYSAIFRDISVELEAHATWKQIHDEILKLSSLIEAVEPLDIDLYTEKGYLAFSITFRSSDRTLKSEEVDVIMKQITRLLQDKFKAVIR